MAWDLEKLGCDGTLGRQSYSEVLLVRHFKVVLKAFNTLTIREGSGAYDGALEQPHDAASGGGGKDIQPTPADGMLWASYRPGLRFGWMSHVLRGNLGCAAFGVKSRSG